MRRSTYKNPIAANISNTQYSVVASPIAYFTPTTPISALHAILYVQFPLAVQSFLSLSNYHTVQSSLSLSLSLQFSSPTPLFFAKNLNKCYCSSAYNSGNPPPINQNSRKSRDRTQKIRARDAKERTTQDARRTRRRRAGPGSRGRNMFPCDPLTRWKWLMGPSSRVQAPLFLFFFSFFSFYQTFFCENKKRGWWT
jgi:hypothetical protein